MLSENKKGVRHGEHLSVILKDKNQFKLASFSSKTAIF